MPGKPTRGVPKKAYIYTLEDLGEVFDIKTNAMYQHQFRKHLDPENLLSVLYFAAKYAPPEVRKNLVNVAMGIEDLSPELWNLKRKRK